MPELGNKYECFSCGAKFYDLGKPDPVCPKCGANQKDARKQELATEQAAKRRRREEVVVRAPVDEAEDLIPAAGDVDLSDEELVAPEGVDDEHEEADDDLDDEE
jgi:uncharacterized protein (TIGR02300 family)